MPTPSSADGAEPHPIEGTDIELYEDTDSSGTAQFVARILSRRLADLRAAYDACSPRYEAMRQRLYRGEVAVEEYMGTLDDIVGEDTGGSLLDYMGTGWQDYVAWFPPAKLPQPCPPPANEFLIQIPGTGILIRDAELAGRIVLRVNELGDECDPGFNERRAKLQKFIDDEIRLRAYRGDASKDLDELRRMLRDGIPSEHEDCYSPVHQPPSADEPQIKFDLKVGQVDGLGGIRNGGLGKELDATLYGGTLAGQIPIEGPVGGAIGLELGYARGGTHEDRGGFGPVPGTRIFLQPFGVQLVPGALQGTDERLDLEVAQVEVALTWSGPDLLDGEGPGAGRLAVTPLGLFFYSYTRLDEKAAWRWKTINFRIDDERSTDTNRFGVGAGLDIRLPLTRDAALTARGLVRGHLDDVSGDATYSTSQTGVFTDRVKDEASEAELTWSAELEGGFEYQLGDGITLGLNGFVGWEPWWRVRYQANQASTLEQDTELQYGGGVRLRVPLGL